MDAGGAQVLSQPVRSQAVRPLREGVIADFDMVQHVVAEGKGPAKELVTGPMYTIEPVLLETNVVDAFERMRDLEVNVVPVVEDKKLLGVVTIQDVWSYIPDENIDICDLSTYDNDDLFYSYRRDKGILGLQASVIGFAT